MESLGYKPGDFPVTEQAVTEILSLPMFAELTDDEIAEVVDQIKAFYK
jgi:dTDP-4-amino-4,6-dideoxygalactose transaminase